MANVRSEQEHKTWRLRRKTSRLSRLPVVRWIINNKKAKTIRLTPDISQRFHETYSKGNKVLAGKANLDLEHYGYFDLQNL